jgi:uncharacterized protein YjdB
MKKVFMFLTLACLVGMASCSKDDDGGKTLTEIKVQPTSISLVKGNSQKVTATPVPSDAPGVTFTWASANTSVATVANDGTVTAVAVGTTTVTVSSGPVKTDIPVTVLTDEVPLVSIGVEPTTVSLPVDDSVTIVTTKSPTDATGVEFTWTSANEEIATVDVTGKIKIVGVGETKVTVSFGSVKTEIPVTGLVKSVTLVDVDGEVSGNAAVGDNLQLSVVTYPANTGLTPDADSWKSSDELIATVSKTGLVTIIGSGYATISATVNGVSGEYVVSTQSALDDAFGYWRFDDVTNIGKATKGTDLFIHGNVSVVPGPSGTNWAVEGTVGERNLEWKHEQRDDPMEFTFMWDTRFYGINQYYSFYWNGSADDASFFARWRQADWLDWSTGEAGAVIKENVGQLQIGRGYYPPVMELAEGDTSRWVRVITTFMLNKEEMTGFHNTYIDGKQVTSNMNARYDQLGWNSYSGEETPSMFFLADGHGNDGDDSVHPMAAIAVWNRVLTEQEIATLGKVK